MYLKHRLLIPTEILLNKDVKQLLPAYITFCILADQTEEAVTQRRVTIREFCQAMGTVNATRLRREQYQAVKDAFDWLVYKKYILLNGINWHNTNQSFTFKMTDSIYDLLQTRDTEYRKHFLPIEASEVFMVRRVMRESDVDNSVLINAMRIYFYLRDLSSVWQATFEDKLPAWCGYFSWVINRMHIVERTFERTISVLKELGLITVTHIKYDVKTKGTAPATIVIFNYLCSGSAIDEKTLQVEKRIDQIYGTNSTWYATGRTFKKKAGDKKEEFRTTTHCMEEPAMYVNDEHIEDTSGTFEQNNRSQIDDIFYDDDGTELEIW